MKAADKLLPLLVIEIAMSGQTAAASAIDDRRRLAKLPGPAGQRPEEFCETVEVGADQLAAGQLGPRARHQARGVRMRQRDLDLGSTDSNVPGDRLLHLLDVRGIEDAVIERGNYQRLGIVA